MFSGLLQPIHLLLILGVVLIVFGPGKLANVGHDLGKSIREFKAAMEAHDVTPEAEAKQPTPVAAAPSDNATIAAANAAEKTGPAA